MEAKEIIDIITGVLASIGLVICIVAASYCMYSMVVVDRDVKRSIKRCDDMLAKLEKEE